MNAAIRAIVRTSVNRGWQTFGVKDGYSGLIEGKLFEMGARDVGGIIELGGTILGSSRSTYFKSEEGRQLALKRLSENMIDALFIIGGNGTQKGAFALSEMGFPVIGIASTIDNDLYGSDIAIGVDTALNVALESIDRIKVTAASHHRIFAVEVMGRDCGYIALMSGIAGGAEAIIIPEIESDIETVFEIVRNAYQSGKPHAIIVTAEGAKLNAEKMVKLFEQDSRMSGYELRTTVLGYVQRGASPSAFDRILATRLGAGATSFLADGKSGVLSALCKNEVEAVPLHEVVSREKGLDIELFNLAEILAR
jgi:6-phosphofructokinase 1